MNIQDIKQYKKYLPVGTVLLIKNNIKTIMIIGYVYKNDSNETKDYIGVYYPEGYAMKEYLVDFNHQDIVGVIKLGCVFDKQQEYNKFLNNELEKYEL